MTDWCILRTSAARTLKLAASLNAAGLGAWTPIEMVRRRRSGGRKARLTVEAPLLPTFVFAPSAQLADLAREAVDPASDHPPFSIMRIRDRVPVVADADLFPLREAEELTRRRHVQVTKRAIIGAAVRPTEGAFAGMTGTIESANAKEAAVNFGGGFVVKIATYLLAPDVLAAAPEPNLGMAA